MTNENKRCKNCNKILVRKRFPKAMETTKNFRNRKFCDKKCYTKWSCGSNHHAWKVVHLSSGGYVIDGVTKKFLHRAVMENYLGRKLIATEVVHHIDGNKFNNSISNLKVFDFTNHGIEHVKMKGRDWHGRFKQC